MRGKLRIHLKSAKLKITLRFKIQVIQTAQNYVITYCKWWFPNYFRQTSFIFCYRKRYCQHIVPQCYNGDRWWREQALFLLCNTVWLLQLRLCGENTTETTVEIDFNSLWTQSIFANDVTSLLSSLFSNTVLKIINCRKHFIV